MHGSPLHVFSPQPQQLKCASQVPLFSRNRKKRSLCEAMRPCFCKRNPGSQSDILFLVGLKLTKRSSQTLSGMTTHCQHPAVFDLRLTDGGYRLHWQMLAEGSHEAACSQQFDRSVNPEPTTVGKYLSSISDVGVVTQVCDKLAFRSQGCLRCIEIKIGIHIVKFLLISQAWLFLESSLGKPDTQQASCVGSLCHRSSSL